MEIRGYGPVREEAAEKVRERVAKLLDAPDGAALDKAA
jgi:hypothetical protein